MKHKTSLLTVLTMVALLGCLGMAAAQSTPPTPPIEMTPQTQGGTVQNGAAISDGGVALAVTGWNYVHPLYCSTYWDGSTAWLYIYVVEGGYWYTTIPYLQSIIAPACQTGYLLGFRVYNASGNWDYVNTYPYK